MRFGVGGDGILVRVLGREGSADRGFRKNRTKISNDVLLQRAGATWRTCAAVSNIAEYMAAGHFVAIFALPPGEFMFASDERADGPMTFGSAWSQISAEPVVLFYAKGRAAH